MRGYVVLAAVMIFAGGCGATIEVKGALPARRMKIAVLDFSDAGVYKAMRDYSVAGAAGSEHPDTKVAQAVRRALAKCPDYDVISWLDMRRTLKADKEVRAASDADAIALGKKLGVEGVVVGEVRKYKQSWTLQLAGWASVAFTARCIEVVSGNELWSARVQDRRSGAIEEDLAADLSRKLCEQLRINTARRP